MNRAAAINAQGLGPGSLPPAREAGRPWRPEYGPLRVLFLSAQELGFGTTGRMLEKHTAGRDDIDAVHVHLRTRGLLRAASALGYMQSWRSSMAWGVQTWSWLRRRLPLDRFDVVHVLAQQRALGLAWASGRSGRRAAPYVVNIDATGLGWGRAFFPSHKPSMRDPTVRVERKIFQRAAAVACWSHWAADSVVQDYGVDPARICMYKPCVPVPNAERASRERVARLLARAGGGPAPPLRLVFVGNDWERKGGDRLLRWHQQRWKDRAELHVCSAKATPDPGAVNVVWHGATPHDKLFGTVLPGMDLFVMPTSVDSFVIAAQEAQSSGLAVVTSRIAGIPEVVSDGETGVLCDPASDQAYIDAVEGLMRDPRRLARMSEAAFRRGLAALSSERWIAHLMDNLGRVARGQGVVEEPPGVSEEAGSGHQAVGVTGA